MRQDGDSGKPQYHLKNSDLKNIKTTPGDQDGLKSVCNRGHHVVPVIGYNLMLILIALSLSLQILNELPAEISVSQNQTM
jgi:hypothetical protein